MMQGMGSPLQEALQKVLENTASKVCAVLKMVSQNIMMQVLPGKMLSGVCSRYQSIMEGVLCILQSE